MVRFIFFCMAFVALSFVIVPLVGGISNERQAILASADVNNPEPSQDSLSFEEIYQTAAAGEGIDPAQLNEIAPAAGQTDEEIVFSTGFSAEAPTALADTPVETEETTE